MFLIEFKGLVMTKISILTTLVLFLVSSLLQAKVVIQNNGLTTSYKVSVEGVNKSVLTVEKHDFTKLTLKGVKGYEGIDYKIGAPQIPTVRFLVKAQNIRDIRVDWSQRKATPKHITGYIYPSQPSAEKSKKNAPKFVFNKSSYKSLKKIPNKFFTVRDAGSVRGVSQKLVTLYPIQYDAAFNKISVTDSFEVTVTNPVSKQKDGDDAFLFVVGKKFAGNADLENFKTLKKKLGYQVRTIVIDRSNKKADKIRKAIQNVYNEEGINLQYALIIGDSDDVPGQKAKFIAGTTDHYYRAIDTNDYYNDLNGPDIGLGRLSAKDNSQLSSMLNKITVYQKGNFSSEEWLKHIAFLATDDRYTVAEGSHNYAIDTYTKAAGYTGVFPNNPQEGGDKLYAITHKVSDRKAVQTMREGRFIINYSGHGATTYWAGPTIKQRDVRSFDDPDARPFVISNACVTGNFNVRESFAETWIRHPQGAILYWGSMDSSYWDEDDIMERAMYDSIFAQNTLNFDGLTQYSLGKVWEYYNGENRSKYYWETYHIFGDPSVRLRTTATKSVTIGGNLSVPVGLTHAALNITDENGDALKGVRVAIYAKNGEKEFISSAISDESGNVTLDLKGATAGTTFTVTAYGNNTKLVTEQLMIIATDSPYLVAQNINVNGESVLYANQSANIALTLKNVGLMPTTGGQIEITSINGPASIVQATTAISPIQNNETMSSNQLELKVLNAHDGDKVVVNFKWSLDETVDAEFSKTFKVSRAKLTVSSVDFGDIANPGLNGINPGEQGEFFITVTNTGTEALKNGQFRFSSANECLENVVGSFTVDSLAPNESLRVQTALVATISSGCAKKELAKFTVNGVYDGHYGPLDFNATGSFLTGKIVGVQTSGSPAIAIPDNNRSGITTEFEIDSNITILEDISVRLDITHTYRGDIIAKLVSPTGIELEILKGTGGSTDNINETLVGGVDFDFTNLKGQPTQGRWKLIVADKANGDIGTFNNFSVMIKGY